MSYKHQLFFNGLYITVWGPESRTKCYQLFFKFMAEVTGIPLTDLTWALQLTDQWMEPNGQVRHVTNLKAYHYNKIIQDHAIAYGKEIHLKCDEFLVSAPPQSSPVSSSRPTFKAPKPRKAAMILEQLTEIVANQQPSLSDGIISRSYVMDWRRRILSWFRTPQFTVPLPTLTFLLVMLGTFGCLASLVSCHF